MSHDHAYNRLTAARSDHTGPHRHPFNTSHLEETGLDVVVRRCLFVLEVTAPRSRDRVVELIFAAETPNGAEPVSREQHRHPDFVPLDRLQHLHLRPPVAGHLRALTGRRSATSGAPYIGNLWRPDETDETDPYWS